MLRILIIGFIFFSSSLLAQEATGDPGDAQLVEVERSKFVERKIAKIKEEILQVIDARYTARLDAMEMERASFDNLILSAKWLGGLASILLLGFAFIAGRSLREIRETSKSEAKALFEAEMRKSATETGSLRASFKDVEEVESELKRLKGELSGYTDLALVARSATSFDPLVQYQSLNKEIRRRRKASIRLMNDDDTVEIQDTIADVDFRQRAAVIFETLILTARNGHKNGSLTIDSNTLFNASQTASSADMDFVALEFMEIASAVSGKSRPEIEASLVRKRITMSRYHMEGGAGGDERAWSEIKSVMSQVGGFDLHLVVSEAFNIGIQLSDPVRMAQTIYEFLPEQLRDSSYTKIVRARLLLMGGVAEAEWAAGHDLFRASLLCLKSEAPSVRWYKHTAEDVPKVLSNNPTILDGQHEVSLEDVFGDCPDIRTFVARFGASAAQGFQQLNILGNLVQEEDPRAKMMAMMEAMQELRSEDEESNDLGTPPELPEDEQ